MTLPLEGITVLALEQAVAAPFASRQLADLGARVIKIERRGTGDFARSYDSTVRGMSSHFVWLNRSKESLTLDVRHPRAPEILDALLAEADVFIQNLSPGATERIGLDAETLGRRFPRLIVCDISGYGDDGPYRDKKAYDLLVQAETGVLSITGTEEEPAKTGISIADIAAGMYAYSGILAALIDRQRTGIARRVPVSLFGALGEWVGYPMYYTMYGGQQPARRGTTHATIAPYGSFDTADGSVLFAIQNEREWRIFCADILDDERLADAEEFAGNEHRVRSREALHRLINAKLKTLSTEEVVTTLDNAGIANGKLNQIDEFARHQQHSGWTTIPSPVGELDALLPPGIPEGLHARMDAIPEVGENTTAILAELNFTAEQITEFQRERLV